MKGQWLDQNADNCHIRALLLITTKSQDRHDFGYTTVPYTTHEMSERQEKAEKMEEHLDSWRGRICTSAALLTATAKRAPD